MNTSANQTLNILVLGGSGFLSGTVVAEALQQGHQVTVVTRGNRPVSEDVKAITVDRKDRDAFAEAIADEASSYDLVVDCIGFEPDDAKQDVDVFRDRAKHLVFVSTDFVFDPARRNFPQSEANQHFIEDGYGGRKRQCERLLQEADCGSMAWTVVRPCHIFGPGSLLGCLPLHGRDAKLIEHLRAGTPLQLVGDGHFLQQPIFARDLAKTILSCAGNEKCNGEIYMVAGPEIVESKQYYQIIADCLGEQLQTQEVSVTQHLQENPGAAPFMCHRIYDLTKLREHGLHVPNTPLADGLREHVQTVLSEMGES